MTINDKPLFALGLIKFPVALALLAFPDPSIHWSAAPVFALCGLLYIALSTGRN